MGGNILFAKLEVTWEWNGEDWLQRSDIPASPRARWAYFMVYDEARQCTALFGGQYWNQQFGFLDDTWIYTAPME